LTVELETAAALAVIRRNLETEPRLGLVLGSGLGVFADQLGERTSIPYREIPHFSEAHVPGHAGNLCFGRLGSVQVACLQGRVHAYEGYSVAHVVFGVRVLAALGCRAVLITNAAGGIRDDLVPGSLMLIEDHLNLTGHNPLVGPQRADTPRFPDMTQAYDPELRSLGRRAAEELNLDLKEGVYAGLLGPSYETPAEIRMLRGLGADAVGMSTVLETIELRARGVRVGALSAITNRAAGLGATSLHHDDVQQTAAGMQRAFVEFLSRWALLVAPLVGPRHG
jgi:purine-nucleoside phosphorylase